MLARAQVVTQRVQEYVRSVEWKKAGRNILCTILAVVFIYGCIVQGSIKTIMVTLGAIAIYAIFRSVPKEDRRDLFSLYIIMMIAYIVGTVFYRYLIVDMLFSSVDVVMLGAMVPIAILITWFGLWKWKPGVFPIFAILCFLEWVLVPNHIWIYDAIFSRWVHIIRALSTGTV